MAIIKIEIKEEHLTLLKHLKVNEINDKIILTIDSDDGVPVDITDANKYEYINLVLNGKPLSLDTEEIVDYTVIEKSEWDKLYNELPIVLSVILQRQSFEVGLFKASWHNQIWKKI